MTDSRVQVLKYDPSNVKALYRRSLAQRKDGDLEASRLGLLRAVELQRGPGSSSGAAAKELAEVTRELKEKTAREKARMAGMFGGGAGGDMYADKERERVAKAKKAEHARLAEMDEWTKSKLQRRASGGRLEEQTFEAWKKERDEAVAAAEKDKKAKAATSSSSSSSSGGGGGGGGGSSSRPSIPRAPAPANSNSNGSGSGSGSGRGGDEFDDEDERIIRESKVASKGYCYFRNVQSEEEKRLIGDM